MGAARRRRERAASRVERRAATEEARRPSAPSACTSSSPRRRSPSSPLADACALFDQQAVGDLHGEVVAPTATLVAGHPWFEYGLDQSAEHPSRRRPPGPQRAGRQPRRRGDEQRAADHSNPKYRDTAAGRRIVDSRLEHPEIGADQRRWPLRQAPPTPPRPGRGGCTSRRCWSCSAGARVWSASVRASPLRRSLTAWPNAIRNDEIALDLSSSGQPSRPSSTRPWAWRCQPGRRSTGTWPRRRSQHVEAGVVRGWRRSRIAARDAHLAQPRSREQVAGGRWRGPGQP